METVSFGGDKMNCVLCGSEIKNIQDYNIFRNNSHIIYAICENCLEHISNGGKFAKIDSLNIDSFGVDLQNAISEWMAYKTAKGDTYSERGKQSLVTRIRNEVKASSENVVIAKIRNSIEKKWKGICWEDNSFLQPQILELFEKTWDIVINAEGKEEAKRQYLYCFKKYSDINKIKQKARIIYAMYKKYIESLSDEKYCKTFCNFLKAEIPVE